MYIGTFNSLNVEVTSRNDVIITVYLKQALPVPVQLVLVYHKFDPKDSFTESIMTITVAEFTNTAVITYTDFASFVPFEHFTIEVGLLSQNVRGPLVRAQGEYSEY